MNRIHLFGLLRIRVDFEEFAVLSGKLTFHRLIKPVTTTQTTTPFHRSGIKIEKR